MTTIAPVEELLEDLAARITDAVAELAARWHRAEARKDSGLPSEQWLYQDGMQSAWVQSIAMLTRVSHAAVLDQLRSGAL
jgi:hypothetical protein